MGMHHKAQLARDRAARALRHYVSTLFIKSGEPWRGENAAEVEAIVDDIIEASSQHAKDTLLAEMLRHLKMEVDELSDVLEKEAGDGS